MDSEISFENSQKLQEFYAKLQERNLSLLDLMQSPELVKSALLNLRLNTKCDPQRYEQVDFGKN
jgi:hypothetical protein